MDAQGPEAEPLRELKSSSMAVLLLCLDTLGITTMKRASGTFWERQARGPALYLLPFPILYACFANKPLLGLIAYLVAVATYMIADLIQIPRFHLMTVHCASNVLMADGISFTPGQVAYIRVISYGNARNNWPFVEFMLKGNGSPTRILCLAKPQGLFTYQNPTIRIILEHFPELTSKVKLTYSTWWAKRVKHPPPPDPVPEPFERHAVDPASRYKDPYFQRRS